MDHVEEKKKEKPRDPIYILVIVLLMVGLGIMLSQFVSTRDNLETCNAKLEKVSGEFNEATNLIGSDAETFQQDLQLMLTEYDNMIAANESMGKKNQALVDSLNAQKAKVEELLIKSQRTDILEYELFKMKKEAATLREIMRGYVHTIDSLMIENSNIRYNLSETRKELSSTQGQLEDYKEITTELEETVEEGKVLKTVNVNAIALRIRRNGDTRDTDRAKRTEMFKVCFVLLENRIAKAGPRNIYMRIISPSGKIMNEGAVRKFKVGDNEIEYSAAREVDYQNTDVDVCVYNKLPEGFEVEEGTFKVEIFADGARVGYTTFDLK